MQHMEHPHTLGAAQQKELLRQIIHTDVLERCLAAKFPKSKVGHPSATAPIIPSRAPSEHCRKVPKSACACMIPPSSQGTVLKWACAAEIWCGGLRSAPARAACTGFSVGA